MSLRSVLVVSVVLLLAIMLACSPEQRPPLVVSDFEVTPAMPGMSMRAGYLTLTNNSDTSIRITHLSSPQFHAVEIHETTIEDGIAKMRGIAELVIPPGQTLRLQRGGLHLMLRQGAADFDENIADVSLSLYSDDSLLLTLDTHVAGND